MIAKQIRLESERAKERKKESRNEEGHIPVALLVVVTGGNDDSAAC